jgi:hypothetical protein
VKPLVSALISSELVIGAEVQLALRVAAEGVVAQGLERRAAAIGDHVDGAGWSRWR